VVLAAFILTILRKIEILRIYYPKLHSLEMK